MRAQRALHRLGINTWEGYADLDPQVVSALPNVGEKTVNEIMSARPDGGHEAEPEDASFHAEAFHECLRTALHALGERQRTIIIDRFVRQPPLTLQQIGDRFGISRERVRQLEEKSLARLRRRLRSDAQVRLALDPLRDLRDEPADLPEVLGRLMDAGASSNALTLLMRVEGWSEAETVEALAEATSPPYPGEGHQQAEGESEVVNIVSGNDQLPDLVVVKFDQPVPGRDPFDGASFVSDRHRVAAVWTRQDASETIFLSEEGEILARWPTTLIREIEWPAVEVSEEVIESESDHLQSPGVGTHAWLERIKKRHPRAYQPWPPEEDDDLRSEHADGLSVKEIADRHQRRPSAIRSRLRKLEIVLPSGHAPSDPSSGALIERRGDDDQGWTPTGPSSSQRAADGRPTDSHGNYRPDRLTTPID